jgi:hypothetical protein
MKNTRPISPRRDAQFVRKIEALLTRPRAVESRAASVYVHPSRLPGQSYRVVSASPFLLPIPPSLTTTSEPLAKPRTRMRPWWNNTYLADPARSYRGPAEWRDTSDILRVLYRHLVLREFGPVHSFTLNLRSDCEDRARSQSNPIGWLRARIARRLAQQLGRAPEFHLVGEEAERRRLHLHGEIQASPNETPGARKAFRLAGGEWDEVRQHQAHTDVDPDAGWSSYIGKDLWRISYTRNFLARHGSPRSSYAITFEGNATASTNRLNARAAERYDQHREWIKGLPWIISQC